VVKFWSRKQRCQSLDQRCEFVRAAIELGLLTARWVDDGIGIG